MQSSLKKLNDWELEWIKANSHRYDDSFHIESVSENISHRYKLIDIQRRKDEYYRNKDKEMAGCSKS